MVDSSKNLEHGVKGEEIMRLLFGEEIRGLAEDAFDGSKEEHQIFEEIFHRTGGEDANLSLPTSCGGSFTKDPSIQACESTPMNFEDTNAFKSFQESYSSSLAGPSAHKGLAMQGKLSPLKHLDQEMNGPELVTCPKTCTEIACLHPSKEVLSVPVKDPFYESTSSSRQLDHVKKGPRHSNPDNSNELLLLDASKCVSDLPIKKSDKEPLSCIVIGTLEQGILSTYNLFNNQDDMAATGNMKESANCKHTNNHIEDIKVVVESKYANSPVSLESVASELMSTSPPLGPKEASIAITCVRENAEPTNLGKGDAVVKLKRTLKRDLPCRLESYAHCLLTDAGWKIEPRQRNDRTRVAYFFINSEERLRSKALTVAWKACGEKLLASALDSERDENGRVWWDVVSFWKDMTDTIDYIDKEAHHQESSLSLLRRWQLLDPFMAVVWIDRKLSTLRAGHGLKAVKSTTFILDMSRRVNLAEMDINQPDKNTGEVSSCSKRLKRQRKRSSWLAKYAHPFSGPNENKFLSSLVDIPSSGAGDNSLQMNMQSEIQRAAGQACQRKGNIFSSTDSNLISNSAYQEFSSLPQDGPGIAEKMPGFETTKLKPKRMVAAPSDGSANKTRKKSKKVAEIGETEVIDKDMETELHDGNCREDFVFNMDGKKKQQLDLVCNQKETDSPISELSSECLQQVELFKKHMGGVHRTLNGNDVNMPVEIKIHNKTIKSKSKAAKQPSKKDNTVMPMQNDRVRTLSEEDTKNNKSAKSECNVKRLASNESSFFSPKKKKLLVEFQMARELLLNPKVGVYPDNGNVPSEDPGDEALSTTCGMSSDHVNGQKLANANKSEVNKKSGKKIYRSRINDDDLLVSAIIRKKNFGSCGKKCSPKVGFRKIEALRKLKSHKGSCMLLLRSLKKGGNHSSDGMRITLGPRTVLCWLIEMGAVSVKDAVQYRDPKENTVLKDGWVTRAGILCNCCTLIFSVSEFKTHAGLKQQSSSLNLFMQSGKPYTLCQLQAWSAEFKKRKSDRQVLGTGEKDENDDTCGLCGDGGDLICCDNCPSTYHLSCLSVQELPEGNWYCPNCICVACGHSITAKEMSSSLAVLQCSQCGHKYHSSCITGKTTINGEMGSGAWFCGEGCQEVFLGLRSRVGAVNNIDDIFSWTILRCSYDDKKVCSAQKIALMAECNTKLAISLTLMEECFLPMVDPRTGIDMIPHILYNMGSPYARLNFHGFYTMVLEKGDQLISAASIRVHGATVAEMPLISTCSEHRRQGMCRRLLNGIEKMLISFKVKMLVLSAIPSLVETWTSRFGFMPIEDEDKQQLSNVNLALFPGTILLKKNLHEASSSTQESEENIDFCSREQPSHSANTVDGDQATENPRSDLDAKSWVPIIANTRAEQVGIQRRQTLMNSSETCVLTARYNEHDAVRNAETCLNVRTSNVNEMDQLFSVDEVECQKPVCKISRVVSPNHTTHDVVIQDMKEKCTSLDINVFTKNNDADAMNVERTTPFEGDEVADKLLSDEKAKKGPCSATAQEAALNAPNFDVNAATSRNIEENTSQNVKALSPSVAANLTNSNMKMSVLGGEVESNLNEINFEGDESSEVCREDSSSTSKEGKCGS